MTEGQKRTINITECYWNEQILFFNPFPFKKTYTKERRFRTAIIGPRYCFIVWIKWSGWITLLKYRKCFAQGLVISKYMLYPHHHCVLRGSYFHCIFIRWSRFRFCKYSSSPQSSSTCYFSTLYSLLCWSFYMYYISKQWFLTCAL